MGRRRGREGERTRRGREDERVEREGEEGRGKKVSGKRDKKKGGTGVTEWWITYEHYYWKS